MMKIHIFEIQFSIILFNLFLKKEEFYETERLLSA